MLLDTRRDTRRDTRWDTRRDTSCARYLLIQDQALQQAASHALVSVVSAIGCAMYLERAPSLARGRSSLHEQLRSCAPSHAFPLFFIAVVSMRWFGSSSWVPLGVVVRAWFAYRSLVSLMSQRYVRVYATYACSAFVGILDTPERE